MNYMKVFGVVFLSLALSACVTRFAEVKPDDATGYFPTGENQYGKATTVVSEEVNLAEFKSLAYVEASDFFVKQTRNIGYFDQVLNKDDLEAKVIELGLQEKVTDVSSLLGLNNLYRNYQPFLHVTTNVEKKGKVEYAQLVAKDPRSGKKLFVSEAEMDFVWKGVNDQNTFYPLFNSFIDWINKNEK